MRPVAERREVLQYVRSSEVVGKPMAAASPSARPPLPAVAPKPKYRSASSAANAAAARQQLPNGYATLRAKFNAVSISSNTAATTPRGQFLRTILVTGATDGVGKQIAGELAANPDNFVIIHGRQRLRCEQTLHDIGMECKTVNPKNLAFVEADFMDFSQVLKMIDTLKSTYPQLNTFISCAAILTKRKQLTKNGLEAQFQVNHLAPFALLNALLPILEKNAPSRILTVGSMLHSLNHIDWEDINCEKNFDKFQQYSRTILMNHLMTFYLHRLAFKHNVAFRVTVNVVDADQKTDRRNFRFRSVCNGFSVPDLSASETQLCNHSGATHTLVRLAESPEFAAVSGKYYNAWGKEIASSAEVRDVRLQNRLWQMSAENCRRLGGEMATNGAVLS